jgi:hypothetical protein
MVRRYRTSQTAVEYLVILAVVLIIVTMLIAVLRSPDSGRGVSDAHRLKMASYEIGLLEYAVQPDGVYLKIINNNVEPVRVTAINVNGIWLSSSGLPTVLNPYDSVMLQSYSLGAVTGAAYTFPVVINYTMLKTNEKRQQNSTDFKIQGESPEITFGLSITEDIADGLVGLWHFDESSWSGAAGEVRDSSDIGAHGTRSTNYVSITTDGLANNAGSFRGWNNRPYINMGSHDEYKFSHNNFSVFAWVKTHPTYSSQAVGWIACTGCGYGTGKGFQMHAYYSANSNRNKIQCNVAKAGGHTVVSTTKINDSEWHFVGCVRSDTGVGTQRLIAYVDGVAEKSSTASFKNASGGSLAIANLGTSYWDANTGWKGEIDEVMIWNRTLTTEEIETLYIRGLSALQT